MNLFNLGWYQLHSGERSDFKIDCDALSEADLAAIAGYMVKHLLPDYSRVIWIPSGGFRLSRHFERFRKPIINGVGSVLIVDDVMTTGASFTKQLEQIGGGVAGESVWGACIFSRCAPDAAPKWVVPLFQIAAHLE